MSDKTDVWQGTLALMVLLAYQPLNVNYDGEFRPIEVRVKRPGVRVRARKGYVAVDPKKMRAAQPIR